tara:strand:- start:184 stop:441 length:258 start_codon:yes stop_codon:yes gene_type:complete
LLRKLLPTPSTSLAKGDETIEAYLRRSEKLKKIKRKDRNAYFTATKSLTVALKMQLGMISGTVKLHPRFVEWMMGFPDGWTDYEP